MNIDDKREMLFDWIRNLDEEALNALIAEYLDDDCWELDPVDEF